MEENNKNPELEVEMTSGAEVVQEPARAAESATTQRPFTASEMINYGLSFVGRRWALVLAYPIANMLVLAAAGLAFALLGSVAFMSLNEGVSLGNVGYDDFGFSEVVALLGVFVIVAIPTAYFVTRVVLAVMYAATVAHEVSFTEGWRWGRGRVLAFWWMGILLALVMMAGFGLLIIPGIIVAVYTIFAAQVFILEDRRGIDALVRSTQLVYGKWWRVAGTVLVPFILVGFGAELVSQIVLLPLLGVGSVIEAILNAFITVGIWAAFGFAARSLQMDIAAETIAKTTSARVWYILFGWIGGIAFVAFTALLTIFWYSLSFMVWG